MYYIDDYATQEIFGYLAERFHIMQNSTPDYSNVDFRNKREFIKELLRVSDCPRMLVNRITKSLLEALDRHQQFQMIYKSLSIKYSIVESIMRLRTIEADTQDVVLKELVGDKASVLETKLFEIEVEFNRNLR